MASLDSSWSEYASITAVDTYVVQYGVWVYATHAFRQSADIARPASVRSVES